MAGSVESESIEIIREAVVGARRPVMLYSTGKDSSVMLHLARKAFHPAPPPFPLLHVDTTWKFRDLYAHRQSNGQKPSDPGYEIWQQVVLDYGVKVLGLKTKNEYTVDDGKPIPKDWDASSKSKY